MTLVRLLILLGLFMLLLSVLFLTIGQRIATATTHELSIGISVQKTMEQLPNADAGFKHRKR
jgi:hypothetical protein